VSASPSSSRRAPVEPTEQREYCEPPPVEGWTSVAKGARIGDALPPAGRELHLPRRKNWMTSW